MKIAEMTTAEQQLELLKMIMSCTWSNFAQQAEREKQQLKKAKRACKLFCVNTDGSVIGDRGAGHQIQS